MPGYDRSGPMGAGPRTGGGFGYCGAGAGLGRPVETMGGFGFGRGRGGRCNAGPRGRQFRRFRNWAPEGVGPRWSAAGANDEASLLKAQAEHVREELASIEARLAQLQSDRGNHTAT
jgi:hypothetical protein